MAGITSKQPPPPLGEAIREAREKRGVSQRKLCADIDVSAGTVSRWETGERKPTTEEVAKIIEVLDVEEVDAEELLALVNGAGQVRKFAVTLPERRAELAEMLAAERSAKRVTQVMPLMISGVLQTAEVIRTVMHEAGVPQDEIEERVITRIGRRDLITRKNPARLKVLLGEAAIRYVIGGQAVWADQLQHLLDMGELPNVELRLIPYSAGWSPILVGSFTMYEFDQDPPIVSLDLHGSGLTLRAKGDIETHQRDAAWALKKALEPDETAEHIKSVLKELKRELEHG